MFHLVCIYIYIYLFTAEILLWAKITIDKVPTMKLHELMSNWIKMEIVETLGKYCRRAYLNIVLCNQRTYYTQLLNDTIKVRRTREWLCSYYRSWNQSPLTITGMNTVSIKAVYTNTLAVHSTIAYICVNKRHGLSTSQVLRVSSTVISTFQCCK